MDDVCFGKLECGWLLRNLYKRTDSSNWLRVASVHFKFRQDQLFGEVRFFGISAAAQYVHKWCFLLNFSGHRSRGYWMDAAEKYFLSHHTNWMIYISLPMTRCVVKHLTMYLADIDHVGTWFDCQPCLYVDQTMLNQFNPHCFHGISSLYFVTWRENLQATHTYIFPTSITPY